MTLKVYIEKLVHRHDLTDAEIREAFRHIAHGEANAPEIATLLALLRAKGEKPHEIAAIAKEMLEHCYKVELEESVVDIVGTGGDGSNTVNISTAAAVLSAACGLRVAKHGNRSVTSRSGSADVLEALGIPMLKADKIRECIQSAGIAFMYAPHHHPAMKHVAEARKAIKIRTVFNIMGPLLNPARAKRLMIGVYHPDLLVTMAQVYKELGVEHALVVHSCGLDELTPLGQAKVAELLPDGSIKSYDFDPTATCGISPCTLADLQGGDSVDNAEILMRVFGGGAEAEGPIGNTIALNAGAGTTSSISEGYKMANEVLKSGKALQVVQKWSSVATRLSAEECA